MSSINYINSDAPYQIDQGEQEQNSKAIHLEGNFTTCTKAVCEALGMTFQEAQDLINEP